MTHCYTFLCVNFMVQHTVYAYVNENITCDVCAINMLRWSMMRENVLKNVLYSQCSCAFQWHSQFLGLGCAHVGLITLAVI